MREGSRRGRVVGPLFPDQWLCPQLPWLLPPAAVPTFSWTYKAGQQQRPLLLCLEHFSPRGHLSGGAPSTADWGCHFSQLSNGQGQRSGRGGGATFLWTWGTACIDVLRQKTKQLTDCAGKWKQLFVKICGSAEGSAEGQSVCRMRHRLLAHRFPHSRRWTCSKTARHRL